jgi:hypothetical protein
MDMLSKLALVGATSEPTSDDPTAAAVLRHEGSVERRMLLAAGARAVARAAGYVPRQLPAPEAPQLDARPNISAKLADAIGEMLDGPDDLIAEALSRVGDRVLPPRLIPRALAVTDDDLRRALRPHLDARARYVASFEPSFGWILRDEAVPLEELARIFDEGTSEAREEALIAARRVAPAVARDWVERVFGSERADLRATFLSALETGLSDEDEAFLERALEDRGAQVREAARVLLGKLPRSAYVARMIARADLEPPKTVGPAEIRDGLLPKLTRAQWLERIVSAVPTSHWGAPAPFLARVAKSDHRDAILAGLVVAARDPEWLDALFEVLRAGDDEYSLLTILENMTPERRAHHLASMIAMPSAAISIAHALSTLPPPWPDSLARKWLEAVERRAESGASFGDPWVLSLSVGARHLPYAGFSALRELLIRVADDRVWKSLADDAFEVLRLRAAGFEEV